MIKLVIANLKMNLDREEVINYITTLEKYNFENLIICPSNLHLELFKNSNLIIGSQDGYYKNKGAYTGEISFEQLRDYVEYSIVGHSERRTKFFESNDIVRKKIESCINNEIVPIICVGENIENFEQKRSINIICEQLKNIILNKNVIIAYEPIFAIGTNITPPMGHIIEVHRFIKEQMKYMYNINVKVLYGGSVNVNNIKEICSLENVDGVLIGGASNNPINLINMLEQLKL